MWSSLGACPRPCGEKTGHEISYLSSTTLNRGFTQPHCTTEKAYYDLKLQLALGQLERRYTVSLGSRKQKLQLLPATFFAAKMRCRLLRKMFTGSFFRGFDQFWQRLQFRYDHERFRQALSGSGT